VQFIIRFKKIGESMVSYSSFGHYACIRTMQVHRMGPCGEVWGVPSLDMLSKELRLLE
jgi:hypothetical protein